MVVETIIPLFRALYSATGYAESEQSWMRWRGVRGNKCSGVPEGIYATRFRAGTRAHVTIVLLILAIHGRQINNEMLLEKQLDF